MSLTAKDPGGTSYEPIPEGVFQAVCYGIYDLGTQYNEKWNKTAHRVLITWETPENRIELEKDGKTVNLPRAISKEYTLSLHQKAQLKKDLENWRGRTFTKEELAGFDLQNILKANCMIQIIHTKKDDKTYANVSAIMPLMKQIAKLKPENPVKFFSFEDANPMIPADTPQWVIDKIQDAKEWTGEGKPDNGDASDMPKTPAWLQQANDAPMAEPPPDDGEIPF
jgi:hypothetical protein